MLFSHRRERKPWVEAVKEKRGCVLRELNPNLLLATNDGRLGAILAMVGLRGTRLILVPAILFSNVSPKSKMKSRASWTLA